jgi:hypothetical protein
MATIREYFKSRLKQYATEPHAAIYAYRMAKADQARGLAPQNWGYQKRPKGHGDVIRVRDKAGKKKTFVICIRNDDSMGPPWVEHDGHGVVSDWTLRDKRPGETEINRDGRSKRFYDVAESIKIAKRDSWGLSDDDMAKLASELGRDPTANQIAAKAVELDCESMRKWCNDGWRWIGVCLVELDPAAIEYPENVADDESRDVAASLWGIESDNPKYHESVAFELISETR